MLDASSCTPAPTVLFCMCGERTPDAGGRWRWLSRTLHAVTTSSWLNAGERPSWRLRALLGGGAPFLNRTRGPELLTRDMSGAYRSDGATKTCIEVRETSARLPDFGAWDSDSRLHTRMPVQAAALGATCSSVLPVVSTLPHFPSFSPTYSIFQRTLGTDTKHGFHSSRSRLRLRHLRVSTFRPCTCTK